MGPRKRNRFGGDAEASIGHGEVGGMRSLGSLRDRHPGSHGNLGSERWHHQ